MRVTGCSAHNQQVGTGHCQAALLWDAVGEWCLKSSLGSAPALHTSFFHRRLPLYHPTALVSPAPRAPCMHPPHLRPQELLYGQDVCGQGHRQRPGGCQRPGDGQGGAYAACGVHLGGDPGWVWGKKKPEPGAGFCHGCKGAALQAGRKRGVVGCQASDAAVGDNSIRHAIAQ